MAAFSSVNVMCPLSSTDTIDWYVGNTMTNSADTGITRTFDPVGYVQNGTVAKWEDRSDGIQVGYPHFELSVRPPVNGSKVNRVTLTISMPTLEQTSASTASGIQPAPTKAYDCSAKLEFFLPERSQRWERKALLHALHSLFLPGIKANDGTPSDNTNSPLEGAVLDYERPY